ncbi:MAG: hypothetical protein JST11_13845, partial [Acidobacteria bacterium]|nr:hypothetical protein [Acidobacteriota bacterium]
LYEDDGSGSPVLGELKLAWDAKTATGAAMRSPGARGPRYEIAAWKQMG